MLIPSSDAMPPPPPPPRRKATPPENQPQLPPPQGDPLRCPRCDSTNTKFCYYNNYSLSQPRHFCKTCRRYWTKGGSLRNIPIGGASRKTKKPSRSSSSSAAAEFAGGLKLFHGISPNSMADFPPNPFGDLTLNPFNNNVLNFDHFPFCTGDHGGGASSSLVISSDGNNDQASSSIESLSAHNLELHWKMQQQRMAMLYGGGVGGSGGGGGGVEENNNNNNNNDYNNNNNHKGFDQVGEGFVGVGPVMTSAHVERPLQPIFFQNLEVITKQQHHHPHLHASSDAGNAAVATEWFFDSSYGGVSRKGNGESNNGMNDATGSINNGSSAAGGQGWGDDQFHQFNGLV